VTGECEKGIVLGELQRQLRDLSRIVRDGNGQPPLIARVLVVEKELALINASIRDMEECQSETDKENQEHKTAVTAIKADIAQLETSIRAVHTGLESRVSSLETNNKEDKTTKREWVKVLAQFLLSMLGAVIASALISRMMHTVPNEPTQYIQHHQASGG
jgi:hypothetical protein